MISKEDILKKHCIGKDVFVGSHNTRLISEDSVLNSMEEYADIKSKERAIGFFVWYGARTIGLIKYCIAARANSAHDEEMEKNILNHEGKSLKELYQQYLNTLL